jgi:hypothetical protein
MWSPKTASALRESTARKKTFGLLNEDLHDGLRSQSDEFYPELFAVSGHLHAHVPRISIDAGTLGQ